MAIAFWLFAEKGITPGQYYNMPQGEKLILRAFANKLIEAQGKPEWRRHANGKRR